MVYVSLEAKRLTINTYFITIKGCGQQRHILVYLGLFSPLKGLSGEMQGGSKMARTMHTGELYDHFASVFIFKETPSREKNKTSFGVLTTIELNL